MSRKGPVLHFPEVTGRWDTQPRPRASPKPPYLAVKPSGEAEQARTGLAAGEGGRPEEGAPQSGAGGGGDRESGSEALAESPHLPHSLVEPVVFLQRNLSRSPRRTCGEWPGRPPITHSHQTNLPPPRGRKSTVKPRTPGSHMTPSPNLTGGGLRRRLRSWGLAPGFWGRRRGPGGGGPGAAPGGPCGAPGGAGAAPWGWGCPVAAEAPTVP